MKKFNKILSFLIILILIIPIFPLNVFATGGDITDWLVSGEAYYDENEKHFVLTEDYKSWQSGSIWYNHPYNNNLTVEMDYYTGSSDRDLGGADGIVVAFYANFEYDMEAGEQMGFDGSDGYGIELDTYRNSNRGDPDYNHISLIKDSVGNHLITGKLPESEDEKWHHLKVVVEDGVCSAYVDNEIKLIYEVESTGYGWVGITSATGSGENLHAVKNIVISGDNDSSSSTDESFLDLKLSHKEISSNDEKYKYEITAEIKNTAESTAKNSKATIILPEELSLDDNIPVSCEIGDIKSGDKKYVKWEVYTDKPTENTTIEYGVLVQVNDVLRLLQENYIYISVENNNDNSIIFKTDQWNFPNSPDYFTDGNIFTKDTYYMRESDYNSLTRNLTNIEIDLIDDYKNSSWGGSCYGMSSVVVLAKMGIIEPQDIQEGRNSIYTINKTDNDNVESLINFYHLQQKTCTSIMNRHRFILLNTSEQLSIIEDMASDVSNGGFPFLLWFSDDNGGHVVVAYGVEHGDYTVGGFWGIGGDKYDSRILIYDCNYPEGSEKSYLYYNTGTDEWTISNYNKMNKLNMACNDIEVLDNVNYGTATKNNIARLAFEGEAEKYYLNYNGKEYSIDASTDNREEGLITYYDANIMADGTYGSSEMNLTLPKLDSEYSVKPIEGKESDFTLYYENSALSMESDSAKEIKFSPDGKVSADGVSGDYSISLLFNDGYHSTPWYKTSVSGMDCKDISMEQTKDGIVIEGNNLKDIEISVKDDEETKILNVSIDEDSLLLTDDDVTSEPIIKIDSDNDGIYDKVYNNNTYKISFDANGGQVSTEFKNTNTDGKLVELPVPIKDGYEFLGWYTDKENGEKISVDTIFNSNTIIYAHWKEIINSSGSGSSTRKYTINSEAEKGGSITPEGYISVTKGANKTFEFIADEGYEIDDVIVDGKSVGAIKSYTFENVNQIHTIKVKFSKIIDNSDIPLVEEPDDSYDNTDIVMNFRDINKEDWFYDAVLKVYKEGIMSGTSPYEFSPGLSLTRGMVVSVLHRLSGDEFSTRDIKFIDVSKDKYYANSVAWANENDIVSGYDLNHFGPEDNITREQLVSILYRYAGSDVVSINDLKFIDKSEISDWAKSAVIWAVDEGIVSGRTDGTFDPKGFTTRAELASILYRFYYNTQK